MSLFRFTRTSQPQGPVAIDWGNPITRGLVFAWTPDSFSSPYAATATGTFSGSGTVRGANRFGKTIAGGTGGDGLSFNVAIPTPAVACGVSFLLVGSYVNQHFCAAATSPVGWFRNLGSTITGITNSSGGTHKFLQVWPAGIVWSDPAVVVATTDAAKTYGKSLVGGVPYTSTASQTGSAATANTVNVLQSIAGDRLGITSWQGAEGLIVQWQRELSDAEMRSLSDNPWQIFQPTNRAIYPETDASPDITLALTGEDVVAAQGSAAPVITVPLTGVAAAAAQGTLTVAGNSDITLPLTGLATVADQGSLLASATVPLAGQAVVVARGTLASETSKGLTGQAVALAQGNVSPQASVALTGQSVVVAQGALVAPGDVTVALTGQGVSLATGLMVGSVTPDAGDAKSGVNRLWLIEYYTKEFAKKEATQAIALEGLTAAAKRKAVKKATVAREAAVEKLVAKAESDLEVLTQGFADIGAAQRFTQALIQQVARKPEPETDFMQVANDYRKRMQQEDDELLLFAMVI